tara:strand:+ start:102 stop:1154 length:1053 start_codon:yes stop_codon:yes gene_type:complete
MSADSATAFLRRVRRRLWLERGLQQLAMALGLGAACMLLMAIADVAGILVSARFIAATTVTIVFALSLKALLRRPTLAESARRADRAFGSKSLFTTAYDIERSGQTATRSGALVARRAAQLVARDGSQRLPGLWSAPPLNQFALSMLPAFLASALLVYTTGARVPAAPDNEPAALAADRQTATAPEVENLQASIRRDRATAALADGAVRTTRTTTQSPAADTASNLAVTEPDPETADPAAPRVRAPGTGDGDEAGNASNGPATAIAHRDVTLQQTQSVEIAREGLAIAGRRAAAPAFDSQNGVTSTAFAAPTAAAAPPSVTGWSSLSTAQSAFARNYLHARNKQGEDKDE